MPEMERIEQELREQYPRPSLAATERARAAVRQAATKESWKPSRWPHLRPRRATFALASVVVLVGVGAFFLGSAFPVRSASSAAGDAPGFLPAPGWTEVSTGTVPLTGGPTGPGPTAIAVNGKLAQEDGPVGTFPTQTLSKLPPDGIVFYVVIGASGSDGGPNFPSRQLPLQLSDATVLPRWEGQYNQNVPLYRIDAAANGYTVSVYAFFGTQTPSQQLMQSAQQELDRLQVPTA
jgi:hypothetical protein